MSLCLSAFERNKPLTPEEMAHLFEQHSISYTYFCEQPHATMQSADLVVRVDRKAYYRWEDAQVIVMSHLVFKQPLPQDSVMQRRSLNQLYLKPVLSPDGKKDPNAADEQSSDFMEVEGQTEDNLIDPK